MAKAIINHSPQTKKIEEIYKGADRSGFVVSQKEKAKEPDPFLNNAEDIWLGLIQ